MAARSFEEKSARHFQYRLNTFFSQFLKSPAKPLGEIQDYAIRVEFQSRGSPHAHCVLWIKNAPKYEEDPVSNVCKFIDQYISCSIPEDGKLKNLVLLLQKHRHSSYCKRNHSCRFNFPHPPSSKTLIAEPCEDPTESQEILKKVRKVLSNKENERLSLNEIFSAAKVTPSEYSDALKVSVHSSVIVLKRKPCECNINNYNPSVLLAWQANIDIQFILNAYACVMYVASYIMKTERSMGELLKRVANETTNDLKAQIKKVGSAFLTHREVSAQEAAYRILSIPLKQLTRQVVFVDTNPKNERVAVLKGHDILKHLEDDDPNARAL